MHRYLLAAALLFVCVSARAEVPMHNPGLDATCPKGFQYSRDTASCKQANCPPGAGRAYTLECSCGEAWGNPFRTCYADGLATHCVAAGQPCKEGDSGGFDPITGDCQVGYAKEPDGTCAHAFPSKVTCSLLDARGQPLAARELVFGESLPDTKKGYVNTQRAVTGADGTATFNIADPKAPLIQLTAKGPEGMRGLTVQRDDFQGCVIRVVDEAGLEGAVRDSYEDLLKAACVKDAELAKVRAIAFDFSGGGKPLYDPSSNTIQGLSASDNYDETMRALIHELSHGMIARTIDSSKDVGGGHNNWVPVDPAKVKGSHGTPESLAFEEGAADFIAMLYFRMRGQVYQPDLEDDTAAGHAIEANGKPASARTESIVTRYLWSVYQPIIEGSPDGPARALADFIATMSYAPRQATFGTSFTDPVRTVHDFIAQRIQRDASTTERAACGFAPVDLGRARSLADAYGIAEIPRTQVKNESPDALASLPPGDHDVPAGTELTIQDGSRLLDAGKLGKVRLGGKEPARFRIEADGKPTLLDGSAVVSDGPARTDAIEVVPVGTSYVVRVSAGVHAVAVDHGQVDVVERTGAARRVTLTAGQAIDYAAASGFGAPRPARDDLERASLLRVAGDRQGSAGGSSSTTLIASLCALGLVAVAFIVRAVRQRRAPAA